MTSPVRRQAAEQWADREVRRALELRGKPVPQELAALREWYRTAWQTAVCDWLTDNPAEPTPPDGPDAPVLTGPELMRLGWEMVSGLLGVPPVRHLCPLCGVNGVLADQPETEPDADGEMTYVNTVQFVACGHWFTVPGQVPA